MFILTVANGGFAITVSQLFVALIIMAIVFYFRYVIAEQKYNKLS
jgi:hypothetical protein